MRKPIASLRENLGAGTHPGLILQRYLYEHDAKGDAKRNLLRAAISASRSARLLDIYRAAFDRWTNSFPSGPLHRAERLRTRSRVIVGLGSENVLETGLRLHHTHGVPIIPGSALKGLTAHCCEKGEGHKLLFGTTDDSGVIIFHDAWITPASLAEGALMLDVMTPHHPGWQTDQAPPTDFDNPTPIPFLSVCGEFDFRVSWGGPPCADAGDAAKCAEHAMNMLKDALDTMGVGGKTSSGYGRFQACRGVQPGATAGAPASHSPDKGARITAQLLERNQKGTWKAKHTGSQANGPIVNSAAVPADKKSGDIIELIVRSVSANKRDFQFDYPVQNGRA